jgi:hypothetical protein
VSELYGENLEGSGEQHADRDTTTTERRAEPRTRHEVIAEARAGPAAGVDDPDDDPHTEPAATYDSARSERAEPRSRQEAIAEARTGPAAGVDSPDDNPDTDGDTEHVASYETPRDERAEPRTRQEAIAEARAGPAAGANDPDSDPDPKALAGSDRGHGEMADPYTRGELVDQARSGTGPLTETASGQLVAKDAADQTAPAGTRLSDVSENHIPEQASQERGRDAQDRQGGETPHRWFGVIQADRTIGDLTPIGIGLKPTGEQLREMESDDLPAFDRFRKVAYEHADDIKDAVERTANGMHDLLDRPTPAGQLEGTPHKHPQGDAPVQAPHTADLVVGAMAAGVLISEGLRTIRNMVERRKVPDDASDRR